MPSSRNKKLNPREKKLFNYWIWLVIIGPAIFFLFYWFSGNTATEAPGPKPYLPEKKLRAGEPAVVDNTMITAAPEGTVTLTEKLAIGSNRIVAEGGQTFMVVPLVIPDSFGDPSPAHWYIVDSENNRYDLLRVVSKNPSGPDPAAISPGNRLVHLIFKIKKGDAERFLVYLPPTGQAAWKLPSTSQ